MGAMKAPRSLRFDMAMNSVDSRFDNHSGKKVSAVAGLIAVASFSGSTAEAQQALPPVNVDAPVERPRPTASKPISFARALRCVARRGAASRRRLRPFRFPVRASLRPIATPMPIRLRRTRSIASRPPENFRNRC